MFEVSFERNGIYHSNLAIAENEEKVAAWFSKNKPDVTIIAIKTATADSMKPGKPCHTI